MYNDLSDTVGEYVRFSQPKWTRILRFSTPGRSRERTGWRIFKSREKQDEASLETLESVFSPTKTLNSHVTARPGRF